VNKPGTFIHLKKNIKDKKCYHSHERRSNMATAAPLSTVIGVFPNMDQAEQAIDELRHARFSYERIRLVERGTGSFFDSLKGMFTGQGTVTSNTAENLIKMGLPEYEAKHYQSELDAHHVLVLMNADDRPEDAFSIMRQNGAFDLNLRLRTTPADVTTADNTIDETRNERLQTMSPDETQPVAPVPPVPPSAPPAEPVAPVSPSAPPANSVAPVPPSAPPADRA
jgi:hypothetical protein